MIACMGGWCSRRNECALYWATDGIARSERLCAKDKEEPEPMRELRAVAPVHDEQLPPALRGGALEVF